MITKIEIVTPAKAAAWLEKNTDNRRVRAWYVKSLAGIITRGEWKVTHQGVAFSKSKRLLDGQHRLMAVVEANLPVKMCVTYDVADDAFMALDQGINRKLADILSIDSRIAEPLRYACHVIVGGSRVTPQQALEVGECGLMEALQELIDFCGTARKIVSSAPFKLAAALRMMEAKTLQDKQYILAQYRAIVNCELEQMSNASQAIIRQVHNNQMSKKTVTQRTGGLSVANNKSEIFARAMTVFDPNKAGITKIVATEESCKAAFETARKIYASCGASQKLKACETEGIRNRLSKSSSVATRCGVPV